MGLWNLINAWTDLFFVKNDQTTSWDRFSPISRYFPVSGEHKIFGIYVFNVGTSRAEAGKPYPVVRNPDQIPFNWKNGRILSSPKILYITRGSGIVESKEGGSFEVTAGNIIFLKPGVWYRYRPDPKVGWDETWMKFEGSSVKRLLNRPEFCSSKPVLDVGLRAPLIHHFDDLVQTARTASYGTEFILAGLAVQILSQILVECGPRELKDDATRRMIERAKGFFLEDVSQTTDLQAIASTLGVSYSTFRRTFKSYTHLSPRQFQLQTKIHKAGQLLTDTNISIGEIAGRMGFESVYYFSQIFKRKMGHSPLNYRNRFAAKAKPE